ncbi:MAG: flagellar biosynthesis anti-sigma factor FlgM [Spirochaetes bacterium]|nr:flagellar biosynthesis anti-sigma factor FlgM [Spirochaetota bacterium]
MVIDKIGNINNIQEPSRTKPTSRTKESGRNDRVEISAEAKRAAENEHYIRLAQEATDVDRAARVREIKNQIANGTYNFDDSRIVEMVADKIASYLLRR